MNLNINENADVSLHDCRTNKVIIDNESITFSFPDGFYIIDESISNDNYNAEVRCHFAYQGDDQFNVYIYRKNIFGKTIREEYTDEFISGINEGKFKFEFVYTYRAYQQILFKGYIWQDKKPYHIECEIEIQTDNIEYSWKTK